MQTKAKFLIIYCHPENNKSLNYSIKKEIEKSFLKSNIEYKTIDLYKENFNPILDSKDFLAINQNMVLSDVQKYQLLINEYKKYNFYFSIMVNGNACFIKRMNW